jgi:hypothetical protein
MKMFALEGPRAVPPPVQCVPRQAWRNGSSLIGERTLAEEVPVAFSYNGATHAVLMATPGDLEDFAVGFSYTEGIVTAPAEIAELAIVGVADGIVLRMWRPVRRVRGAAPPLCRTGRVRHVRVGEPGRSQSGNTDGEL